MSEGKFTIEDAENDGLIKREVGPEMEKVANREFNELYDMFMQVCEDKGMDPQTVLSDGVLRAIKDKGFSERIANLEVNMSSLKSGDLRRQDAKMLKDFAEELGLDENSSDFGWLEDTVRDRIQSKTSSPIQSVTRQRREGDEPSDEMKKLMAELNDNVSRLAQKVDEGNSGQGNERKDIDEVFGGSEEQDEPVVEEEMSKEDETEDKSSNPIEDAGEDSAGEDFFNTDVEVNEEDNEEDGEIAGSQDGVIEDE